MSPIYRINEPALSHELIDGEVVIIKFDTGNYYSLSGSAAAAWMRLRQPAGPAELAALFVSPPDSAVAELAAFVAELAAEELVVPAPAAEAASGPSAPVPYEKPVLNKYTDMQQLLLADPLHEVEEAGWPRTKDQLG
jgi:hypothetical protein